jgi:hypothetical protein
MRVGCICSGFAQFALQTTRRTRSFRLAFTNTKIFGCYHASNRNSKCTGFALKQSILSFAAKPPLCIPIGMIDCSQGLSVSDTSGYKLQSLQNKNRRSRKHVYHEIVAVLLIGHRQLRCGQPDLGSFNDFSLNEPTAIMFESQWFLGFLRNFGFLKG